MTCARIVVIPERYRSGVVSAGSLRLCVIAVKDKTMVRLVQRIVDTITDVLSANFVKL